MTAKNNIGILINLQEDSAVYAHITNSLFENNTCQTASIIMLMDTNQAFLINNAFVNNFNALGNIFIHRNAQYTGIYSSYLSNDGKRPWKGGDLRNR